MENTTEFVVKTVKRKKHKARSTTRALKPQVVNATIYGKDTIFVHFRNFKPNTKSKAQGANCKKQLQSAKSKKLKANACRTKIPYISITSMKRKRKSMYYS